MKKLVLSMIAAGLLVGCSSFPSNYNDPVTVADIREEMKDTWSNVPALSFMKSNTGNIIRKYAEIPEEISKKPVKLAFKDLSVVTIGDLLYALRAQGLRVISRLSTESAAALWDAHNFEGDLGELVQLISDTNNLGFEFRRGNIYITEGNQYSASMPQHDEFLQQVEKAIKSKGATGIQIDLQAGQIHFQAKPDAFDGISDYLESVAKNSAMVTLQVAVLTVGMNRDIALGLDWAALGARTATGDYRSNLAMSSEQQSSGSSGTTTTSSGGSTAGEAKHLIGNLLGFVGGSGLGYQFGNKSFSLTAAVKALSTYGNARTEQNVVLGTLSGLPVKITSGNEIPYVKELGSTTASGGSVSGSTQTEIVRSGLTVDVTPRFDAADGTVVTEADVDLSSLVGFRELKAGSNFGTISQPEMQKLTFKNVGRTLAGETLVVGGITYDQISNNYNNLPGLEKLETGSKAEKVTRNAIYILIRPTVTVFTPHADELNREVAIRAAASSELKAIKPVQAKPKSLDVLPEPAQLEAAAELAAPAAEVVAPVEAKE